MLAVVGVDTSKRLQYRSVKNASSSRDSGGVLYILLRPRVPGCVNAEVYGSDRRSFVSSQAVDVRVETSIFRLQVHLRRKMSKRRGTERGTPGRK